ncbi:hypothetical protein [Microlunatus sp. Y2014]|uniref:hypothetical protein n=1 Tax=Microlunatus sp. Y2014 TaxID=3418488 RepID=UPI003DA6FF28
MTVHHDEALLRVELPFAAELPRFRNDDLGLRNLSARLGPLSSGDQVVTLLDAPDQRLLRSGVQLAHRVADEVGEWYLAAPDWLVDLPAEHVVPLTDDGDLPDEILQWTRPFRRNGTLGPVAALTVTRREFTVRNVAGESVGRVLQERVTVRRTGLITARFHEVTVQVQAEVTVEQRAWIRQALIMAGASVVDAFPQLVQRLGAPATGPSDFPDPADIEVDAVRGWVSAVVAGHVRRLVLADLCDPRPMTAVQDRATRLRADLAALSPLLGPDWMSEVSLDLAWLGRLDPTDPGPLQGQRYLGLLDALASCTRHPDVGDAALLDSRQAADQLIRDTVAEAVLQCDALTDRSDDDQWQSALEAVRRAADAASLGRRISSKKARRRATRVRRATRGIDSCVDDGAAWLVERAAAEPAAAFELGREYERRLRRLRRNRRNFVAHWVDSTAKQRT